MKTTEKINLIGTMLADIQHDIALIKNNIKLFEIQKENIYLKRFYYSPSKKDKFYSEEEIKRKLSKIKYFEMDMVELNELIINDELFNKLFGDEE
jgi:hypothetical protein